MQYQFRPIEKWPRAFTSERQYSRFKSTYRATLELLERELEHLNARNVVIQLALQPYDIRQDGLPRANARPAAHPGVILSFEVATGAVSMPCDNFTEWEANLRAIALSLEVLRQVDRYGVTKRGEQYRGWQALPEAGAGTAAMTAEIAAEYLARVSGMPAGRILQEAGTYTLAYRAAARRLHPDAGGNAEDFKTLQTAAALLRQRHNI